MRRLAVPDSIDESDIDEAFALPASGEAWGVELFGTITYDWYCAEITVTAEPRAADVDIPTPYIMLGEHCVAVGHADGSVACVGWHFVRELSGWSPVATEQR